MTQRVTLRLLCASAFASLVACSDEPEDPRLIDPMEVRAVGMIRNADDKLVCNHTMIGPNLSATSLHCLQSWDRRFVVLDQKGTYVGAAEGNLVAPGPRWFSQSDSGAEPYMSDEHYIDMAGDKAITLLTGHIGDISGTMQIAPLYRLNWQPLDNAEEILSAPVFLLTYRPDENSTKGYTFYRESCRAFRLPAVTEVIAHDCPTRSGVSGSPIVTQNEDGKYLLIAIHVSVSIRSHESTLAQAFNSAYGETTRLMRFASTFGSMPALCETLSNCRANRNADGHATLALTD